MYRKEEDRLTFGNTGTVLDGICSLFTKSCFIFDLFSNNSKYNRGILGKACGLDLYFSSSDKNTFITFICCFFGIY